MKRGPIEIILRALRNALANWPLVVFRVIEFAVFAGLVIFTVVTTLVPVAVTAGLGNLSLQNVQATSDAIVRFLIEHATLIGWVFVAISVAFLIMLVVHSFIVAGSSRIYGEAERAATGDEKLATFDKFDFDTFWDAAWDGWWRVFMIYNLGGAAIGLVILAPMAISCLLIILIPSLKFLFAIMGVIGTVLGGLAAAIFGALWILRALAEANARDCDGREALGHAWRAVRGDFMRHFLAGLLLAIISLGGASFAEAIARVLINSNIFVEIVQSIAWGLASGWWLAAFIGMAEETRA